MNVEKLKRLQQQVRIGGKGTPRRKKKITHQTAATDDKKLQSSLKKLSVSTIPGIEEVNIIKDDLTVIHFNNPKAQASLSANTFAVTGHGEVKKIVEMLPELLPQLGQETVVQLRMFANSISNNQKQTGELPNATDGTADDDDDVPILVVDFDQVAKIEATKQNASAIAEESQKPVHKNEKDTKEPIIASVENTTSNAKKAPPVAGSVEQKKLAQKPQTKPNETQKKQAKEKGPGDNQKNEKTKEAMKRNDKPKDKLVAAESKAVDQVSTKSVKQVSSANEQPTNKSVDNGNVSLVGVEGIAVPKELVAEEVEVKENKQENVKSKGNKKENIESKENKQEHQQTDEPVVIDKGKKQQQKMKQDKPNARQPIKQTDKVGANNAIGQAKSVESKTKSTNQDDGNKQLKAEKKKVAVLEQKLIIEAVQLTKTDSSEANKVEPTSKTSMDIKEKQLNEQQKPQPNTVEIDNSASKKDKSSPDANTVPITLKHEQIESANDGKALAQKTEIKAKNETKATVEVKVVKEQLAKPNVEDPLAVENVNKPKAAEQPVMTGKVLLPKSAPKQTPVKKSPPPQGGKLQQQPKSNIPQEQGNVQDPQASGASKAKTLTGPIQQTGVKQQSPSKSPPKQQQQTPNKKDTEAKKQEGTSKQKSGAVRSQMPQQPVSNSDNKGQKPAVSPNKPITPATPTTTPTTSPATPASSTPKPTTPIATSPKGGTPTPGQPKKANTPPQKSENAVKGPKSAGSKAQNQQTPKGNANAVQPTQQDTKGQKVQKNIEANVATLAPLKAAVPQPSSVTKTAESPQSPSLPAPLVRSPVKVDLGAIGIALAPVKEAPANEPAQIAVSPTLAITPSTPAPAPLVAATPIPTTAATTALSALPAALISPIGVPPSSLSAAPTLAATPSSLIAVIPTPTAAPFPNTTPIAQVAPIGTTPVLVGTPPAPQATAPLLISTTPAPSQISTASGSAISPLGTPSALGELAPLQVATAPAPVVNPSKPVLTATTDPIIAPSVPIVPDPNLIATSTAVHVSLNKPETSVGPN